MANACHLYLAERLYATAPGFIRVDVPLIVGGLSAALSIVRTRFAEERRRRIASSSSDLGLKACLPFFFDRIIAGS